MKMYGIKNCDVIKKATTYLAKAGVGFQFHDYKTEGIAAETLHRWIAEAGIEQIVNRRSTTFKELSAENQHKALQPATSYEVVKNNTSILKRPILEQNGKIIAIGFDATRYAALLGR